MRELLEKVRQKAALETQQMELLREQKALEKEVFDLKIIAHNEQADVENMEGFSVKSIFLKITGKHEERLEEEQRQARTAKARYDFAAARLGNIKAQLAHIGQTLPGLAGCEEALSAALAEKLEYVPCKEENALVCALESALRSGALLQETGERLDKALDTVLSWLGAQPRVAAISGGLHQAVSAAQGRLNEYRGLLEALHKELAALGYPLEIQGFAEFGKDYLLGLFANSVNYSRCSKIQQQILQIHWKWKTLCPQLEERLVQARITWMENLCRNGEMEISK